MTDRFNRFTERARKALQLAQEEAQRFNHNYIGTEHILLGLIREERGIAAQVLNEFGAEIDKVRSVVESTSSRGDRMVMGEIGLTPEGKRSIELAVDNANRLDHHYMATEHLLLGVLEVNDGPVRSILEELGLTAD